MKKVKITTIILAIILITLVAFGGVYIKTQNRMENKVKDYTFSKEIGGGRTIILAIHDDEHNEISEEDKTTENYEIIKQTIENRLNNFGATDYTISLNRYDGTIVVELPEDDKTDMYAYLLTIESKVQINEEDEDGKELLSDSMIEKALYTYTSDSQGRYQVYMQLFLTKEGQAKFEEIKNNYAVFEDEISEIREAQEENEDEEENNDDNKNAEELQTIAILTIAGSEYSINKFEDGKLIVKIGGQTSNTTSVNNNISAAAEMALLINSGKYPIEYEILENRFVESDITTQQLYFYAIIAGVILLIVFVLLVVNYKVKGLLASISIIGYISVLSLILRYTNVCISIEGIGAILLSIILNIRMNQIILEKDEIDYKKILLNIVPVIILTLVCSFTKWTSLNSFGLVMFWGLLLNPIYNIIVTKTLLKIEESK